MKILKAIDDQDDDDAGEEKKEKRLNKCFNLLVQELYKMRLLLLFIPAYPALEINKKWGDMELAVSCRLNPQQILSKFEDTRSILSEFYSKIVLGIFTLIDIW